MRYRSAGADQPRRPPAGQHLRGCPGPGHDAPAPAGQGHRAGGPQGRDSLGDPRDSHRGGLDGHARGHLPVGRPRGAGAPPGGAVEPRGPGPDQAWPDHRRRRERRHPDHPHPRCGGQPFGVRDDQARPAPTWVRADHHAELLPADRRRARRGRPARGPGRGAVHRDRLRAGPRDRPLDGRTGRAVLRAADGRGLPRAHAGDPGHARTKGLRQPSSCRTRWPARCVPARTS